MAEVQKPIPMKKSDALNAIMRDCVTMAIKSSKARRIRWATKTFIGKFFSMSVLIFSVLLDVTFLLNDLIPDVLITFGVRSLEELIIFFSF